MARRRRSELELCFDSMSDLITNLAGGLVLIALLVLGVTQPSRPPPGQSIRPLYTLANDIELEARRSSVQLQRTEQLLADLASETEALEEQWSSAASTPPAATAR